jgi:hypothetical protein
MRSRCPGWIDKMVVVLKCRSCSDVVYVCACGGLENALLVGARKRVSETALDRGIM